MCTHGAGSTVFHHIQVDGVEEGMPVSTPILVQVWILKPSAWPSRGRRSGRRANLSPGSF
eukprot:UC1_evm2s888